MEYIALFYTHSGALKFEKDLTSKNIKCTLVPTPRKLSSSCGISVIFTTDEDIQLFNNKDIEKIFLILSKKYILKLENQ